MLQDLIKAESVLRFVLEKLYGAVRIRGSGN